MAKRTKRLEKVRRNPKNVSFDELRLLLEDYGFELRPSSGSSHHFFRAEWEGRVWKITIPFKKPHIAPVYVRDALKLIDEVVLFLEEIGELGESDDE